MKSYYIRLPLSFFLFSHIPSPLVSSVESVQCRCETNMGFVAVVLEVEALDPGHAVDEVKTLSGGCADVADDEVDLTRKAAEGRIQLHIEKQGRSNQTALGLKCIQKNTYRTGPDLRVDGELVVYLEIPCMYD